MLNKAVLNIGALNNVTQAQAQSITSQTQKVQADAVAAQPAAKAVGNEDSFVASLLGMAAPILGLISGGSALPIMNPLLSNFLPMLEKKFPQIVRKLWDEISKLLSQHSDSFLRELRSEVPKVSEGLKYLPMRHIEKDVDLFAPQNPQSHNGMPGFLGNSHFLATLASVVGQQPNILRDNIRPHINAITTKGQIDKFDVRFYGEGAGNVQEKWVTVDSKSVSSGDAISAALYEQAYAQFRSIHGNATDDATTTEAYYALTGKKAILDDPTQMRTQALLNILGRTNPMQGDAVTLGSRLSPEMLNADGIPSGHMFTVLGTYQDQNEWRVTLRNPWGVYEPGANNVDGNWHPAAGTFNNDGIFSVPLAQVQEDFEAITYPAISKLSIPQLGMS